MARPTPELAVDDRLFVVFALAWAAGVIHVQAAIDHLDQSTLESVLFVWLATAQFLWGAAVHRGPTRWLLIAGAVVSVGVVVFWIFSRTTGIPFGPHPWKPESFGLLDALASADELALALLVAFCLLPAALTPRRVFRVAATGLAVVLILLSSLTLAGASTHVH